MKLNPEVFRKAAEMVLTGKEEFSCFAVDDTAEKFGDFDENHLDFYKSLFFYDSDGYKSHLSIWWIGDLTASNPEGIKVRVIALLLAADILESGVDIS